MAQAELFLNWLVNQPITLSNATNSIFGVAGGSGNFVGIPFSQPMGRLTLQSGIPVMVTSTAGATTVFYTPYIGQHVPLWNGSMYVMTDTGGELSQATTDATKSPTAVTTNSVYDVFVWNDSGIIRATRGPAWSTNTTRGTGAGTSELIYQNGLILNKNAITNGPAAERGTYVGTHTSNGTSTVDFIFGSAASGGGAAILGVWNNYNRRPLVTVVVDNGVSYTYTSNVTRTARNSGNNRISFVLGLVEDGVLTSYYQSINTAAVINAFTFIGIGFDSTTVQSAPLVFFLTPVAAVSEGVVGKSQVVGPALGSHFIQALESGDNVNANTINSQNDAVLSAMLWM